MCTPIGSLLARLGACNVRQVCLLILLRPSSVALSIAWPWPVTGSVSSMLSERSKSSRTTWHVTPSPTCLLTFAATSAAPHPNPVAIGLVARRFQRIVERQCLVNRASWINVFGGSQRNKLRSAPDTVSLYTRRAAWEQWSTPLAIGGVDGWNLSMLDI